MQFVRRHSWDSIDENVPSHEWDTIGKIVTHPEMLYPVGGRLSPLFPPRPPLLRPKCTNIITKMALQRPLAGDPLRGILPARGPPAETSSPRWSFFLNCVYLSGEAARPPGIRHFWVSRYLPRTRVIMMIGMRRTADRIAMTTCRRIKLQTNLLMV